MKRFRECTLDQPYLLPPSLQDWLPEGHLARFVAEVVETLDLSAVYVKYERGDGRGLAAYHPMLMLRLLIYGYATGRRSSRQMERATYEEVPFRYLTAKQHPDHDTIAAFRKENLDLFTGLFLQVLKLCKQAGLIKLGHIAIDGTKIHANASRDRNLSQRKLSEEEQRLQSLICELLQEADAVDAAEDAQYGAGKRGDELPEELNTAEKRLAAIRAAKQAMEEEHRQRVAAAESERQTAGGKPRNETERKRWQRARQGMEERPGNLVDPDSRRMKQSGHGRAFLQGYNGQIAVDGEGQIIVAAHVSQHPHDKRLLAPMAQLVRRNLGRKPKLITADAGYWSGEALLDPALKNVRVLVPPDGGKAKPGNRYRPRTAVAEAMRRKLASAKGALDYGRRKAIVEPVFGCFKEHRNFRRFLLRGLAAVNAEWLLMALTHNLKKLFGRQDIAAPALPG
jgi:transposase